MTPEQIAAHTGKLPRIVRAQLTRVSGKVRNGAFSPAPLPIEARAQRRRVYLAGPDVFRPDAVAHGRRLAALCAEAGFDGLYPLDNAAPGQLRGPDLAAWIYQANIGMIRSADIVMANVNDFRGPGEPDSGTAFEIGFAVALGKEIWCYTTDTGALADRVPATPSPDGPLCQQGFRVEDFGASKNLMIACSARIVAGGADACIAEMSRAYRSTPSSYRQDGGS
ncbi:nucleoside 2-deoxyribosyltransferase [Paraburkholderia domus]|uniref:nucleoside 2-deoxyribosyltransferase n=1 Tax=Paraburkholderia domus TaxID=2793075 RepID=UPI00191171FA|nr:nucleoside 2-deoxyribosyltransferase [Paraburkholderia domus]MBK5065987.1 nucleoside 2-deoxyribosyltransferase [Burkholderia sp. R-70199]